MSCTTKFLLFAALTVMVTVASGTRRASAGDVTLTPDFDYSVPSRFTVPEIPDPQPPSPAATRYFAGPVRPASWRVDLDACASEGPILSYRWEVDGALLGTIAVCDGMSFDALGEGTYAVTLTVADAGGGTVSVTRDVRVQDWLIFGLGDSYASGEGVPDEPVTQAQIDAVGTVEVALEVAQAAASARLIEHVLAQDNLDELLPLLITAQTRYSQWQAAVAARNDACDNFPPTLLECAEAQAAATAAAANLTSALLAVGLEELFGAPNVLEAIADLRSSAEQAVSVAQGLLEAAQAAVIAAGVVLDAAIDDLGPRWQSRQCHRSQHSGQVQAARALEDADPHTSVTFVHLACSGALSGTGLLTAYEGQEPDGSAPRQAQLDDAATLSAGREIDAMVVSIGGNDVRFADLIEACMLQEKCFETPAASDPAAAGYILEMCAPLGPLAFLCEQYLAGVEAPVDSAESIFLGGGTDCGGGPDDDPDAIGLDDLPCNYDALDARLEGLTATGDLDGIFEDDGSARFYLTAYPSLTRREAPAAGESSEVCGFDPADALNERARNLPGVSRAEMLWAESFVAAMLTDTMRDSATTHGWRFVEDHVASFDGHGYCADDNWIVRIQESIGVQGRIDPIDSSFTGSVHPNEAGQQEYARVIADALLCDFYPGCDPALGPRESRETEFGAPTSTTTTTMSGGAAVCGDATGDGLISASDALQVLLAAVATGGGCAPCRCDVDMSGGVTASDALAVLLRAVGGANALECVACA